MIETEAWVLHRSTETKNPPSALDVGEFRRESFAFENPGDDELLVEPLYGSWEGNMGHSISRRPIDVCAQRGDEKMVPGNTGVARVLSVGSAIEDDLREGQIIGVSGGVLDAHGFMSHAYAYDAPGTIGLLAKRSKIKADLVMPLPEDSSYSLDRWAAFMVRYITAWSNWKVAYGSYRLRLSEQEDPEPWVWGWGGGTTFAELLLAKHAGCKTAMISGNPDRLEDLRKAGILAIDRKEFPEIFYDERRGKTDADYKESYRASEKRFLEIVGEVTGGRGVSIFVDYMGAPVQRATLKSLGRPAVVTTAGWKLGMQLRLVRAIECIQQHTHVHTHYARRPEWIEARDFAVEHGWMPEVSDTWEFDRIDELARAAIDNKLRGYFPTYTINAES